MARRQLLGAQLPSVWRPWALGPPLAAPGPPGGAPSPPCLQALVSATLRFSRLGGQSGLRPHSCPDLLGTWAFGASGRSCAPDISDVNSDRFAKLVPSSLFSSFSRPRDGEAPPA